MRPTREELNTMLSRIPVCDKIAAFDALVREFQGNARFVHTKLRTREVKTGPSIQDVSIVCESYPVYEFVLRVNGHDDFAAAVLKLLPQRG